MLLGGTLLLSSCNDKPEVQPATNNYLAIYPNPTTDQAYIEVRNQNTGSFTLKVFDTKGKLLLEKSGNQGQNQFTVPLENEPKGKYLVILKSDKSNITKTLLKL